jgi:uncharacterized protein with PIN domain
MTPDEIRFAADGMLQSLGTWLRLMGYDCICGKDLFGRRLLELAAQEQRVFLTRNLHLGESLPKLLLQRARRVCVDGERLPQQLREVAEKFCLDPHRFVFTRCLTCNTPLHRVDKREVIERVPPRAGAQHEIFLECAQCRKIFWHGSHVTNSIERLYRWLETKPMAGS